MAEGSRIQGLALLFAALGVVLASAVLLLGRGRDTAPEATPAGLIDPTPGLRFDPREHGVAITGGVSAASGGVAIQGDGATVIRGDGNTVGD